MAGYDTGSWANTQLTNDTVADDFVRLTVSPCRVYAQSCQQLWRRMHTWYPQRLAINLQYINIHLCADRVVATSVSVRQAALVFDLQAIVGSQSTPFAKRIATCTSFSTGSRGVCPHCCLLVLTQRKAELNEGFYLVSNLALPSG